MTGKPVWLAVISLFTVRSALRRGGEEGSGEEGVGVGGGNEAGGEEACQSLLQ